MTGARVPMHLIRIGRRTFNLDHLVMTDDPEGPIPPEDGGNPIDVTMFIGRTIRLTGPEAAEFRARLAELLGESAPAPPNRPATDDPRPGGVARTVVHRSDEGPPGSGVQPGPAHG